jgi:uncharacterized protein (DUF1015 family)
MADIQAFRGFRYDLGRAGALGDVVAPPYDVIDPTLQDALYQRSPYNVIRLILNKETPADTESNNRYSRAAQTLRDWQREGIVVQDSARSLYVYHQEFDTEGRHYTRRGFMARVRLEPFGQGPIYPHEHTMSGPKEDRLKLTRATGMNLSQVFGMYPDADGTIQSQLDAAVGRSLPLEATDHLGVVNRLWSITDLRIISAVTGLMGPKPIFIADGHHRYETALRYRDERRQAGETNPDAAINFVLMMLVSMQDPGLIILPTHRLVSGVGEITAENIRFLLGDHFDLETVGTSDKGARDTWELIQAHGRQNMLGFGTVADGVWQTALFRAPQLMTKLAGDHSHTWHSLGVSILQVVVLGKLMPGKPACQYVHSLREVTETTTAKKCQLAVLVPPANMIHVEKIAGNLEKMPAKSTYFYPKLLSGLVFHSLKGN